MGIGAYFQRDKEKGDTLSVKSLLKGSPAQMCNQVCRACLSERRAPPRRCGAGARAAATEPCCLFRSRWETTSWLWTASR